MTIDEDAATVRGRLIIDATHWRTEHEWGATSHEDARIALDRLAAAAREGESYRLTLAMLEHPDHDRQVEEFKSVMVEEAAAVPGLRAEVERLREALERIVERHAPGDGEADYDIARAALSEPIHEEPTK